MITESQRVGIFVDVQNLYYSARHKYDAKVDFEKLRSKANRGRQLIRALAYIVETDDIDQTQFRRVLENQGYEVKSKELRCRPDGSAKGDWDMGIAIDTISISDKLDVICLVSGDGDFVDLIEMLKSNGVRVEVYSFPSSTAEELKEEATEYHAMDEAYLL